MERTVGPGPAVTPAVSLDVSPAVSPPVPEEHEPCHVRRALGEEVSQLEGHADDVPEAGRSDLPRRTEAAAELEAQPSVVNALDRREMAVQAPAVERRPLAVDTFGDVGHDQVGVEVRVECPACAVDEPSGNCAGGREQVVPARRADGGLRGPNARDSRSPRRPPLGARHRSPRRAHGATGGAGCSPISAHRSKGHTRRRSAHPPGLAALFPSSGRGRPSPRRTSRPPLCRPVRGWPRQRRSTPQAPLRPRGSPRHARGRGRRRSSDGHPRARRRSSAPEPTMRHGAGRRPCRGCRWSLPPVVPRGSGAASIGSGAASSRCCGRAPAQARSSAAAVAPAPR